jgi:hypothetical protein
VCKKHIAEYIKKEGYNGLSFRSFLLCACRVISIFVLLYCSELYPRRDQGVHSKHLKEEKVMVRFITAIFTAADDPEFGEAKSEVILLAPDLVLERFDNEANVFRLDNPVTESQQTVCIDRSTCARLEVDFLAEDNRRVLEIGFKWISEASFVDVLRTMAKKISPSDGGPNKL